MNHADLPPLRTVIEQYGLWATKALGQNFILDPNITDRIVREGRIQPGAHVVEVGPGPGGLTRSLLIMGAQVTAIEQDPRCVAALQDLCAVFPTLTVVAGDALKYPWIDVPQPFQIVANLPYNVATPLLIQWLRLIVMGQGPAAMTLMFQREVADRLMAAPNTSAYGRLSILTQLICQPQRLFDLPPSVFVPAPKVYSTVVHLTPHATPQIINAAEFEALEQLTQALFSQRRKMLRASLKQLMPVTAVEDFCAAVGVDPTARPETLAPEVFLTMVRQLK